MDDDLLIAVSIVEWEKRIPCEGRECPIDGEDCPGPCDLYNSWLHENPIEVQKRELERKKKHLEGAVKKIGGRIIWD